jgi:uncharacterized membrane protein
LTVFGIDTKCTARYNVAENGADQEWANTAMYNLLLISVLSTGSCIDGRCVADILIIVVFIVAVIYGNEAFDHSIRK